MRSGPDGTLYFIVARPRRVGIHQPRVGRGKNVIVRGDWAPDLSLSESVLEIVADVFLCENASALRPIARDKGARASIRLVFTRPKGKSELSRRFGGRRGIWLARVVNTDRCDCMLQGRILGHGVCDVIFPERSTAISITTNNPRRKVFTPQDTIQLFDVVAVVHALVPYSYV